MIDTNSRHRSELSSDLGAIAGLLFEIGTQKLALGKDEYLSEPERKKLEKLIEKRKADVEQEKQEEVFIQPDVPLSVRIVVFRRIALILR